MKRFACLALLLACAAAAVAQYQETRSVHGKVTFPDGEPVAGAVVAIENTKSLQVRTYITGKDGSYAFHGLSTEVDYTLTARRNELCSSAETLSKFSSKKDEQIDLKMPTPK